MGGPPSGPRFDGALAKVFGDNSAFTATIENQIQTKSDKTITLPGKIAFDSGKARFEMNLSDAKGIPMPPDAAAQMKSMGLDQMITLTIPDKNVVYLIYPGLESYVRNPLPAAKTGTNDNFKVETTELGKETIDGHPCVENKVVITGTDDKPQEFTVWNATDLKKFPIKIVHVQPDTSITMLFKDVSLSKPPTSAFELPVGYTGYDNMQTMMQTEMMKKMSGGGMAMPPGR